LKVESLHIAGHASSSTEDIIKQYPATAKRLKIWNYHIFFVHSASCPYICSPFGELAQLVERLHGMQEVSGSTPLFSTV
jgi:hypothetical protein